MGVRHSSNNKIMYECMKIVSEWYKRVSSGKVLGKKEKGGTSG